MTPQSTRSKASVRANNPADDADPIHAYVEDGALYVMADGRYRAMRQFEAWSEWAFAATSPIASTQERARQIKAAMDEAYPERLVA